MTKKTLAVDFDGVIHAYSMGWQNGTIYDAPVPDSIESLYRLSKDYNIVILTTRANAPHETLWANLKGAEAIKAWIEDYTPYGKEFKFTVTGQKVPAIAYIDDRAVRFTNWSDIRKMFQ